MFLHEIWKTFVGEIETLEFCTHSVFIQLCYVQDTDDSRGEKCSKGSCILNDEESLREAPGPSAGYRDSGKARVLLVQSGRAVLHLLGRVERRLSRRGCLSRVLKDKQGVTWNRGAEEGGQASHRTACQGPGGAERSPCLGFCVYFISLLWVLTASYLSGSRSFGGGSCWLSGFSLTEGHPQFVPEALAGTGLLAHRCAWALLGPHLPLALMLLVVGSF